MIIKIKDDINKKNTKKMISKKYCNYREWC